MFDPKKGITTGNTAVESEAKCHPSCTYGTDKAGPLCRKHQAEKDRIDEKAKAAAPIPEAAAEVKPIAADAKVDAAPTTEPAATTNPMDGVKFPPLDNLGSHFYDNEVGTFWVGLNLRNDPMVLALTLDGAKLPMVQASLDFRGREQRRQSLITRVKEQVGGMKEGLEKMLGRVGAGTKSILSR